MQTHFPFFRPEADLAPTVYNSDWYSLNEAQRMLKMSRVGFYRFRNTNGIGVATGRKVLGSAIVRALERARGLKETASLPSLRDYGSKLKSRVEVCLLFEIKLTSLYKLRVRHQVPLLPGGNFHIDDINTALEAEQRGERRAAGQNPIRVMTRSRGQGAAVAR